MIKYLPKNDATLYLIAIMLAATGRPMAFECREWQPDHYLVTGVGGEYGTQLNLQPINDRNGKPTSINVADICCVVIYSGKAAQLVYRLVPCCMDSYTEGQLKKLWEENKHQRSCQPQKELIEAR